MSTNDQTDLSRRKAVLAAALFVFVGVVFWAATSLEGRLQVLSSVLTLLALAGAFVWKVLSGKSDVDEALLDAIRAHLAKVQASWSGVRKLSSQLLVAAALVAFGGPLSRHGSGIACAKGQELEYLVLGSTERAVCDSREFAIWSPFRLRFLLDATKCLHADGESTKPYAVKGELTCVPPCEDTVYLEWGTSPQVQCSREPGVWEFDEQAPVESRERCKRMLFDLDGLQRQLQRMARVDRLPGLWGLSNSFSLALDGSLHIDDGPRQIPVRVSYTGEGKDRDGALHLLRGGHNYAFALTRSGAWCMQGREVVPAPDEESARAAAIP